MNAPAPPNVPELLAPAGDWDCLRAAVENGADAVYFGLDTGFNARARAANFALDELPQIMAFLHGRQVHGYVTVNTLVFPSELPQVQQVLRQIAGAGADAVLVQDLGLVRLIRRLCPDLSIHASTQMTLTSAETIRGIEALGVERVVLARELSIEEVANIRQQTEMPLEVFVHGALCVAYSGQCMTSESLGGRSANRGQCAQACRLPYELICDGEDVDLGDQRYLLSPQDLAAHDLIGELVELGVSCFKIEGRLKTPEYVANITRHYRLAIDEALAGRRAEFSSQDLEEMELSFSRGFSPGWLQGCDHKMLVPATSSAKRGVLLGQIARIDRSRVYVELQRSIKRGDGVAFEQHGDEEAVQGGRVYEVFAGRSSLTEPIADGEVALTFKHGSIDFGQLHVGQNVWKTDDPALSVRLRKTFEGGKPLRQLPLAVQVEAIVGAPLTIVAQPIGGPAVRLESPQPLEEARKHPLDEKTLSEQFSRLGGTHYRLETLEAHIDGEPMVPFSVLGQLRHQMVQALDDALARPKSRRIAEEDVLAQMRSELPSAQPMDRDPRLHVLCRSLFQLQSVLAAGVDSVMVDLQDIRQYAEAVETAHASGATILLATPRIQKPGEAGILRVLTRHGADGVLVRNLAGVQFYAEQGIPFVADFSLNVANELAAAYLHELGARRMTVSYDLNRDQLMDLVSAVPPDWLEVVIHQHMPMFHMEHCVFCAVLSPGTNKHNCGRPCDDHQVQLRDRVGMEHPLHADVGCRNTLYNATPQSAAEVVPALLQHGLRDFRIELVSDAPGREIRRTIELYRDLLAGQKSGKEVWSTLQAANRVGVTRGTLEERRNPLALL